MDNVIDLLGSHLWYYFFVCDVGGLPCKKSDDWCL